jgi:hypothetical protein
VRAKYLVWLSTALLFAFVLSASLVQAQHFGVSPAEVRIDNLPPGKEVEFELTIHNNYDAAHIFIVTTHHPWKMREGRSELPDNSWISFSPQEIEVAANSKDRVKVKVAVPPQQKWVDKDWEIWLSVTPKEKEFLVVNYYIRLLVSTSSEVKSGANIGLIAGITAALLLGCGIYYFKRRVKSKGP